MSTTRFPMKLRDIRSAGRTLWHLGILLLWALIIGLDLLHVRHPSDEMSSLQDGPEANKLHSIKQALEQVASIYRTRDMSVPTDRMIGLWPDFDGTKLGGKPIFSGADPQSIADPQIRAAYEQALVDHDKLLSRLPIELHKLQEGDDCASEAWRILKTSSNSASLMEAVANQIASMPEAPWIKERLSKIMLLGDSSKKLPVSASDKKS